MTLWMLGGVFALVGAPMVWLALRTFAKDRAIATWPKAPGVVIARRLESSLMTSTDNDGFKRTDRYFRPIVQYTYKVGDQTLEGSRIHRNDDTWTGEKSAQRDIDKYPLHGEVMVLHDPA